MEWITCTNVSEETWRRLMELANNELAYEEIEKRHGPAKDSSKKANYKKQASQIRASLLQAKEYFFAASNSSLYTKANHLYYGMVALNTATMLMLGSGEKSLDVLRKEKGNSHHGLDFSTNCTALSAKNNFTIFNETHVAVCQSGFFKNWYTTLPKVVWTPEIVERHEDSTKSTNCEIIGSHSVLSFETIKGRKTNILNLLQRIPDIAPELVRYGIEIPYSRLTQKKVIRKIKFLMSGAYTAQQNKII